MLFRQLFDRESSTYTYLIADRASAEAILVDPVLEQVERDLKLLEELDLTLRYCLETHIHADHITGAAQLRSRTGCLSVVPEGSQVDCADQFIQHGETLHIGAVEVQAIATPGHTDSHMAYLVNGTRLLTGDALLIRGCGRTDFQSGNAETLFDSVTQRLFTLPEATLIYPAHDYRGHTVSSVAEEKRWNPRFVGRSRDEFKQFMNSLNLPDPQKMMEALPANERCGQTPAMSANTYSIERRIIMTNNTRIQEIDAQTLKQWLDDHAVTLVDVREPAEYATERIPGAKLHPLSQFDPQQLRPVEGKSLVLYCQSGNRSTRAAQKCVDAGFDSVVHLHGGILAWKSAGYGVEKSQNAPISLFRQVQIVAGSLVVVGTVLGVVVSPGFLFLSGFVGAGLVFAGITNTCAMGMLLAKLPYNQQSGQNWR